MQIRRQVHNINAKQTPLPEGNYLQHRIGFWGLVLEQNSMNNTVTVLSDTGFVYNNVPVMSTEWVTVDDKKDFIPSTRNLPPKNSRVFVLTPTYTAVGAFVLCSGFSRGDENIRTLWAQNENELEEKNGIRETKTQGGWDIQEVYENGNRNYTSHDEKVKLDVALVDKDQDNKKSVTFEAWNNTIKIDEKGIVITDKNNNTITRDNEGIKITDTNNNVITMNNKGISIKDKNSNEIKLTETDIQVNANTSNKIKIGNSLASVYSVINTLINQLNSGSIVTAGSPAAHTITGGQFSSSATELAKVLEG